MAWCGIHGEYETTTAVGCNQCNMQPEPHGIIGGYVWPPVEFKCGMCGSHVQIENSKGGWMRFYPCGDCCESLTTKLKEAEAREEGLREALDSVEINLLLSRTPNNPEPQKWIDKALNEIQALKAAEQKGES